VTVLRSGRESRGEADPEWRRLVYLLALTFGLALGVTVLAQRTMRRLTLWSGFMTVIIIVMLGVVFDVIGVAATRAQEPPFLAMASKRLPGARHALYLVRNADRVATICCDVVGDIAGTLSGAAGFAIVIGLLGSRSEEALAGALTVASIASFTVLGKALGKRVAIREANTIIRCVGTALDWGGRLAGRNHARRREGRRSRNGRRNAS
jgi:hypothetical protein